MTWFVESPRRSNYNVTFQPMANGKATGDFESSPMATGQSPLMKRTMRWRDLTACAGQTLLYIGDKPERSASGASGPTQRRCAEPVDRSRTVPTARIIAAVRRRRQPGRRRWAHVWLQPSRLPNSTGYAVDTRSFACFEPNLAIFNRSGSRCRQSPRLERLSDELRAA